MLCLYLRWCFVTTSQELVTSTIALFTTVREFAAFTFALIVTVFINPLHPPLHYLQLLEIGYISITRLHLKRDVSITFIQLKIG
jgi:hypothetical protein